ncbi:MAG: WecB/TagA/CpsF family glycosyltransferase [Deltaproteobacteria bacterium]|jgi:N-acetylglucosaminyldiphosphoundecaprenol N-acetyl-beta-D-mannosaminyltransferase|nr:WecB/TagA/CpsF family glycosyltransferase [Deltaproteobacteria bacterium]
MTRETIVILGIPVDNLDMDETVERILALIEASRKDGKARLVVTVNVDFIVNTMTWRLSRFRHPELINILRRADLVTPDGMPIIWTSRMLGTPLKERVTGADLVPRLAQAAARNGKSIYFLGGQGDVGLRAARLLQEQFPGLKVAGADSPFVKIEGEALTGEIVKDQEVVERINRSGADILLIGFGNPKQEVWFERNRSRLQVPVSIGIGGTYEFIVGTVARAPEWMQKAGLEWIFRITQDPKRLWKRYFVGFFKFGLMILPAIAYYKLKRRMLKNMPHKAQQFDIRDHDVDLPDQASIRVIRLPEALDARAVDSTRESLENQVLASRDAILDFKNVKFIDSSGLGFIVGLWRRAKADNKKLNLVGIQPSTRRFFELSRTLDVFKDRVFDNLDEAVAHIAKEAKRPPFYYLEVPRRGHVMLQLFGTLDAAQMKNLDIDAVLSVIGDRDGLFDLENLDFVDSSGILFFLKIQKHVQKAARECMLFGLQDNVRQMFRITKLDRLFSITADMLSAERRLEEAGRNKKRLL